MKDVKDFSERLKTLIDQTLRYQEEYVELRKREKEEEKRREELEKIMKLRRSTPMEIIQIDPYS
jgi:hypothetical protein